MYVLYVFVKFLLLLVTFVNVNDYNANSKVLRIFLKIHGWSNYPSNPYFEVLLPLK